MSTRLAQPLTPGPDPDCDVWPFLGSRDPDAVCILHRVAMAPRVSVELPVALDSQALRASQGRSALLARSVGAAGAIAFPLDTLSGCRSPV